MDKQNFQIILYVVFGFLIVVGFASLALYGHLKKNEASSSSASPVGSTVKRSRVQVLVWGTLDAGKVEPVFRLLQGGTDKGYDTVRYVEKSPETIKDEYVEAIAYDGRVPDLFLLESGEVFDFEPLLKTVPFGVYPLVSLADYQRTFIPAAGVFLRPGGYIALPLLSDGLVLYYNENLWLRDDVRVLPKVWSDFTADVFQRLIEKYRDTDEAVVPFGAYGNYANAPYVFSALMLQSKEAGYSVSVKDILTFYTSFADPRSSVYSWSESFLNARSMFVGGRLLFYPGFVSEYKELRRANPNLVINVAPLPQLSADRAKVVPTKFYTLSIPKKGRLPGAAFNVMLDSALVAATAPQSIFDAVLLSPPIRGFGVGRKRSDTAVDGGELSEAEKNVTDIEEVFTDSVFPGRSIPLSSDERVLLLRSVRDIVIGARPPEASVATVHSLFR